MEIPETKVELYSALRDCLNNQSEEVVDEVVSDKESPQSDIIEEDLVDEE